MWGLLVGEAKKLADLPMWLQYYPKTLFDTINRSGSGIITKQELRLFFTGQISVSVDKCSQYLLSAAFLDLSRSSTGPEAEGRIAAMTEESYAAITSSGDVPLDFHIYKLSFLNFLLGKQPNGPGQYIFG